MNLEELDKKIIFKSGTVSYSNYPSFHTGKMLKGLVCNIDFENIEYVTFEGSHQVAEFNIFLFVEIKSSFLEDITSSIINKRFLKKLIGTEILLPVDPETDLNDNSIYLNYGHTPVDVLFIEFLSIENNQLKANIKLKILGKVEDTLPFNLITTKIIILNIN